MGSYTNLLFHVIIGTRNREPLITPDLKQPLLNYIGGILNSHQCVLLDGNGVADHVHLIASLHPTMAVADVLRLIKANSSKWVHENGEQHADFWWQGKYGAFSVSQSGLPALKRYLARQEEHHKHVTFEEELVAFLERHNLRYDRRFLFE